MGEIIPLVSNSYNQYDLEFKAKLIYSYLLKIKLNFIYDLEFKAKLIYSYLLKIKLNFINDNNICGSLDFYDVDCSNLKKVLKFISCKSAIKMDFASSFVTINDKIIEKNISLVMEKCNNDYIKESLQKIKDSIF
ncbi:MAG: hypothetical protein RXQ93_01025 [Caldisphaera sp.]